MHRGSSKGPVGPADGPERLPLSASPLAPIAVDVEIRRSNPSEPQTVHVPPGTTVRALLKSLGQPPEGSAVWLDDEPVPLDAPISAPCRALVVPTFSGG